VGYCFGCSVCQFLSSYSSPFSITDAAALTAFALDFHMVIMSKAALKARSEAILNALDELANRKAPLPP
jgi:hypothetical protein